MEHFAGVRPTVKDRRPLVGTHAEYSAIHILNGLGTREVLGPSMAKALYNAINDIPLDSAIDIKDLSQKSEITVLFLEIRIIGDKHINIYIPRIVLQMEIRRQGQLLSR
jgi:hypothetical protein